MSFLEASASLVNFTKETNIIMESKLNHSSIEAYSNEYAKRITSEFYKKHEEINGKQIVELSNIRQINFFILKTLFENWKKETEKLESPYFNYNDKEVSEALNSLMNVLSQNISIKKNHFEPLLIKAVHETILLIFSPFEYFGKEINNPEKTRVSLEELHEISRYIKVNNHFLEALITKFMDRKIQEVYNDEAYRMLREVFEENKEPTDEDYKIYLELFSEKLPLTRNMIFEETAPVKAIEDNGKTQSANSLKKEKVKPASTNFFNQQLTLNEKLNANTKSTIADLHQKKKIENIKKHISIYQRFMFINELFDGKVEEFDKAVTTLDECNNYEEALQVIDMNYMSKYNWNMEAEEVNEFLEILTKRYN